MSDFKALVVKLGSIDKHPNADLLSVSTILGEFPAIFRTGQYEEGQLVSFIPYDAIVPDTDQFHFLAPKDHVGPVPEKYRTVKARKIRGVYSDCILVDAPEGFQEGDDVIEHFGLKKREYEEELPDRKCNDNENAPKTFSLFKYDLEGLAHYSYAFEENEEVRKEIQKSINILPARYKMLQELEEEKEKRLSELQNLIITSSRNLLSLNHLIIK